MQAVLVRWGLSEPLVALWPAVRGPQGGELERDLSWLGSVAVGLWVFLVLRYAIELLVALRLAACGGGPWEGSCYRTLAG